MTKCNQILIEFPVLKAKNSVRRVSANFDGGSVSSDGGLLLLREVDRRMALTKDLASTLRDPRDQKFVIHDAVSMLRQRVFGICQGYEDLNDHDRLKNDILFQTAVGSTASLASPSTLCRFEDWGGSRDTIWGMHRIFFENFIKAYQQPPEEIVLDFDGSDSTVYGNQEGRFFHGHYEDYCFLPLFVTCNDHLLVSYLRRANLDGAHHAWAILKVLVSNIRKVWPETKIIFRADSGFCRPRMLNWCDKNKVDYVLGLQSNKRLLELTQGQIRQAEEEYKRLGEKQKLYAEFLYQTVRKTWSQERRIIAKAEYSELGANTRFVVTTLTHVPKDLYEKIYCARGDMENRIKEIQTDMFATRTSCHEWWSNQLRICLAAAAYILMSGLQRLALQSTELARAQCSTLRTRLLKVGAVIVRNTRAIKVMLSSSFPMRDLYLKAAQSLNAV
jgi:hypothetical protein